MPTPMRLQQQILALLAERAPGKTICPSEVARAAADSSQRKVWEPLMEPVRAAARTLVVEGKLVITQKGKVVDGDTARGPLRLRLR